MIPSADLTRLESSADPKSGDASLSVAEFQLIAPAEPLHQTNGRCTAAAVILLLCTVLLVQIDTLHAMLDIWLRADTYTHGLLIFPISMGLIWWQRDRLQNLAWQPSFWGLLALLVVCGGWLLTNMIDVLSAQQFMLVAMIPALVWAVLGIRVVYALLFPLTFLIFAVPFGDFLIPHLMEFTASFTVKALQLSSIPVFREGFYFSIPNGLFVVAEVCSGIRYLIASIALGSLYAYLNYSSKWRRLSFFAVAIIVPIIANGLRAYGIVMIAYFSDMQLGRGIDHLVYGWLFFGVVMFLMFWIGTFFQERRSPAVAGNAADALSLQKNGANRWRPAIWLSALAGIAIMSLTTLVPQQLDSHASSLADRPVALLPVAADPWSGPLVINTGWRPAFHGADLELNGLYQQDGTTVQLYIARYSGQQPHQGRHSELINYENRIADDKNALLLRDDAASLLLGNGSLLSIRAAQVRWKGRERLVWYWYDIAGRTATFGVEAKLFEAWNRLIGQPRESSLIAISTEYEGRPEAASVILDDFVRQLYPALVECLSSDAKRKTACAR